MHSLSDSGELLEHTNKADMPRLHKNKMNTVAGNKAEENIENKRQTQLGDMQVTSV